MLNMMDRKDVLISSDFYTEGPVMNANGELFVTNLLGKKILKYQGDGRFTEWGTCSSPNGQFIAADGTHYVCNSLAASVERFDADGNHLETYFRGNVAGYQVKCPNDLWVGEQGIYFTDSVRKTGAIVFIPKQGQAQLIACNLDYPNGIVYDEQVNCLYVAESFKNRIIKVNLNLPDHPVSTLVELPKHPSLDETKNLPDGLSLEENTWLWIAHYGMGQYHRYHLNTGLLESFDSQITLCSNICVSPDAIVLTGGEGEPGPGKVRIIQRGRESVVSDLNISKLSLGTVALGLPYVVFNQEKSNSESAAKRLIVQAHRLGITSFDTAREYGTAESLLGHVVESGQLENATIISKFKWTNEACFDFEKALAESIQSVEESLSELKLKQLPICLFHMVSSFDISAVKAVLPRVFEHLKSKGLIETAGVSVDHPLEIKHFLDNDIYQAFQIPINIFDHRLTSTSFWQDLTKRKKIIFVRSIYLKGLLLQDPEKLTGSLQLAKPYLRQLKDLADEAQMSVSQMCFSYIRDLEGVSSVLIGPDQEEQLLENIALLDGPKIPKAIFDKIMPLFSQIPEDLLTPRLWKM